MALREVRASVHDHPKGDALVTFVKDAANILYIYMIYVYTNSRAIKLLHTPSMNSQDASVHDHGSAPTNKPPPRLRHRPSQDPQDNVLTPPTQTSGVDLHKSEAV